MLFADAAPDVYVLAGQSNMSGRGAITDLHLRDRIADPRIRLYGNDGQWRTALDPLDDATGQIDTVSADKQAAVGPGLPFARAMRRTATHPIALVPCAKGGTSIGRWKPAQDRATLYGSCVARVREAGGHLAGLLWYQGESDAEKSLGEALGWTAAFVEMAGAFRHDLGVAKLPIVIVQIADSPRTDPDGYPSWRRIQAQQVRSPLPCSAIVSTRGLARNPDDLHLTTGAQQRLGPKLAAAMAGLIRRGCR
ncbi:sialate O-acetylesterase [Sphingomonas montana]|uniref:sialate O-acetylesterase n=1 Tax=Sphingomonas montana TaxID=1843236 RepID=UPI001F0A46F8|nr:sialate O-acetylesterase [Sphingomonas montana]